MFLYRFHLMFRFTVLVSGLMLTTYKIHGQTFDFKLLAGTEDMLWCHARWADFDNDGDYDILLSGANRGLYSAAKVYRNDSMHFTFVNDSPLLGWFTPSAWGDFNNDGMLDLIGNGGTPVNGQPNYQISINNGCEFRMRQTSQLILSGGVSIWKDFDNDGDMDLLCQEKSPDRNYQTKIYLMEDNDFSQAAPIPTHIRDIINLQWNDYDKDGDLDIFILGYIPTNESENHTIEIYENNDGDYQKIEPLTNPFPVTWARWADIEGDGDLDIILTGNEQIGPVQYAGMSVYINEQGNFGIATVYWRDFLGSYCFFF